MKRKFIIRWKRIEKQRYPFESINRNKNKWSSLRCNRLICSS